VRAYLADPSLNATKAAESAGYSPKTAASQASRLLRNVNVRKAVKRRWRSRAESR
jgi:phage terminase small subunit